MIQRWKGKVNAAIGGFFFGGVQAYPPFINAGAPTNGGAGTLATIAPPGSLLIDTTNKVLYQNTNTKASPTWTALTTATGAGTYTGTFDGIVGGTTPAAATITALIASGLVSLTDIATGITAHSGGTQAAAFGLTHLISSVDTVAVAADSVKLPAATAGKIFIVLNNAAANSMQVFGSGTDTINGVATATGVAQAAGKIAIYVCLAAGNYSRLLSA